MRALALTVSALTALGCANAGGAVATAAVNTAIAATASGVRRANGECFTPCNPGTQCAPGTGLCEPLPCGGRCRPDETCERTSVSDRCVPSAELKLRGVADVATDTADAGAAPLAPDAPPRAPPTLLPK
jgi:hypothetical protein